jgi:hypothetical protein
MDALRIDAIGRSSSFYEWSLEVMDPVTGIALLAALATALVFAVMWVLLRSKHEQTIAAIAELNARLQAALLQLERFGPIEAARKQTERARVQAQLDLQNAREESARMLATAHGERESILEDARKAAREEVKAASERARATRERAEGLEKDAMARLRSAVDRADSIVEAANRRADAIAGQSMTAVRDAAELTRVAEAMRNLIEGYGDQYIRPTAGLLDDLAAEFGFTDAGAELKRARQESQDLIAAGGAARCDYAEANRREAAEQFIVSAFNGRVDAVLARSKHSNFGKLEKEIRDIFELTNRSGAPFRNARITEAYLDARISELRWACAAHEIRRQMLEEQRAERERIRDEERARREFERVSRESAREGELLARAREQAMAELAAATEAERAEYEHRLQEISERLREVEDRALRAKSMAEQTKKGTVYVISNVGSFGDDVFKIGLTRRLEPQERIDELGDASVPFPFDVHAFIESDDAPALERALHKHFLISQVNKVNHRKEFFRAPISTLRSEIEALGINAHWTLLAAAHEYRESLRIDRLIEEDPSAREAWLARQLEMDPLGTDGPEVSPDTD